MLKLTDLALRPDFQLGPMLVSPSRRLIEGPGGYVHLEPLIMHVFLLLLDAGGKVVTRNELFDQCWGGVFVGDDSLNRAIAKVRRAGAQVAPGLFEIETIPRTGYRLTGEVLQFVGDRATPAESPATGTSRRFLIGGAAAAAIAGASGIGVWALARPRDNPEFDRLMKQGQQALASGQADLGTLELFRHAAALQPGSAKAWGLLAYVGSLNGQDVPPGQSTQLFEETQRAAANALAIDPREPNALTATALIREGMDGWAPFDQRLRKALAIDPGNVPAMTVLVALLQAAGLTQESWGWNERALALEPLSPVHVFRKALKLWIMGRTAEGYKVIDRAAEVWPNDPGVWNARFVILAFTERAGAALAMLNDKPGMLGPPAMMAVWRDSLAALADRTPAKIAAATKANLKAAQIAPGLAAHGAMVLGALDQVDAAYEVIDGFLLSRGPILVRAATTSTPGMITSRGWKWTQWLFTPVAASLRADPRFPGLCDAIGLTEYWRKRGVEPDYRRAGLAAAQNRVSIPTITSRGSSASLAPGSPR